VEELYGQEELAAELIHSLILGRLAHTIVLHGPQGSGKSTLAKYIARALLCTGEERPCGRCGACIRASSMNHPDLIWCLPKRTGAFRVEDVEALQEALSMRSYEGGARVAVLPDAQRMTEEAQNKMLKILEEPPEGTTIILLTASLSALLPTVKSRCAAFSMRRSPQADVLGLLRRETGLSEERILFAAASADGWLLRALQLAKDEERWQARQEAVRLLLEAGTASGEMQICGRYQKKREDLQLALEFWEMLLRDARLVGTIPEDQAGTSRALREIYTEMRLEAMWLAVQKARAALAQNAAVGMTLDAMLAAWAA